MKVLMVNKFHYLKGGSEKYYFELADILKENGHEVAFFSMDNEKNISTGEKEYFVEKIDLNTGSKLKAMEVIYSKKNYKKMLQAIDDFKPDIVHLNNFQRQLSASVVKAAKKRNIPIVYTAHDLQAICPAISMLDANNNVCTECMQGKYKNCFKKKCVKNSKLKSLLGSIEGKYYRRNKIYTNIINKIITPSFFYKDMLVKDGIPEDRVVGIHNFIKIEDYNIKTEDDGYALYLGRLSKEKGIIKLIEAISIAVEINDKIKLYIAGAGPEEEKIKEIIKDKKLENNVTMLGFLNQKEVKDYIRKASFLIIPSIWYENCPYSVLETQAIGKPIIGSNLGGIPELVKDNENGIIYQYDDVNELAYKIEELFKDKKLREKYSKNAKEYANKEYSKEAYYEKIISVYKEIKGE